MSRNVEQRAEAVRRFNRFYTKQIGVLHEGLLQSPFALTEVRVLSELAHHENIAASGVPRKISDWTQATSAVFCGVSSIAAFSTAPPLRLMAVSANCD